MGIQWPDKIKVEITCDGLYFGEHGYKETDCVRGSKSTYGIDISDPCRLKKSEWFDCILRQICGKWAFLNGGFVCPKCLRQAADSLDYPA